MEHAVVNFGLILQDLLLRNKSEMASSWADRGSFTLFGQSGCTNIEKSTMKQEAKRSVMMMMKDQELN